MKSNETLTLRPAGIELLPLEFYQGDAQAARRLLEMAKTDADIDPGKFPPPILPVRQIFTDHQGEYYLVLPTVDDYPLALPYITGSDLDWDNGSFNQGGFLSLEKLLPPEWQSLPPSITPDMRNRLLAEDWSKPPALNLDRRPLEPLPEESDLARLIARLKGKGILPTDDGLEMPGQRQPVIPQKSPPDLIDPALFNQVAQLAASGVQGGGEAVAGAVLGLVRGQLQGLLQSHLPKELSGVVSAGFDLVMNQAQAQLSSLIAGQGLQGGRVLGDAGALLRGENTKLLGDLASGAGTMAVDQLVGMGFDALTKNWTVDDESSTLEHVAHKYGKQVLGMIQDYIKQLLKNAVTDGLDSATGKIEGDAEGLLKKLDEFFNGIKPTPAAVATATLPAAHIAAKDDKADVVVSGQGAVLVEGKPVARITDVLMPSKMIILGGSATVLAGGLPVSRVTAKTAVPSVMLTGAPSVLIGGPVVSIPAPVVQKPKPIPPPPPVPPEAGEKTQQEEPTPEAGEKTQQEEPTPEAGEKTQQEEPTPEAGEKTQQEEPTPEAGEKTQQEEPTPEATPPTTPHSGQENEQGKSAEFSSSITNEGVSVKAKVYSDGGVIAEGKYGKLGWGVSSEVSGGANYDKSAEAGLSIEGKVVYSSPKEGDQLYAGSESTIKYNSKNNKFELETKAVAGLDAAYSDTEIIGVKGSKSTSKKGGFDLEHSFELDGKGNFLVKRSITIVLVGGIGIGLNYNKKFPVQGTPFEGLTNEQLLEKLNQP